MSPTQLAELLGDWGYATYVVLLCATGVGSPIPEDLILATAGYLISAGVFGWPGAVAAGVFGIVVSDVMLYGWGRRLRAGAGGGWLQGLVRPRHLANADRWLSRLGGWSVFVARLLPGTRAMAFIGAGFREMPFGRFLIADVAGAIIWVPVVLVIGAQLGDEIGGLDRLLGWVGRMGTWIALAVVVLVIFWARWRVEESKF